MEESEGVKPNNVIPFNTLSQRVAQVQASLVGEKGSKNTFGKYNYRNAEDILTELKPLLMEHNLFMQMEDHLVEKGGNVYVEARVMVSDASEFAEMDDRDNIPILTSVAFAREPMSQSGMSPSQMTGTASSYARKYALGAMFLLSGEACPDFVSAVCSEIDSKSDSPPTVQDKGKGKSKDKSKDKDIVIPKLGTVGKDVNSDMGDKTPLPIVGSKRELGELDPAQLKFLFDNRQKYFKETPVFCSALEKYYNKEEK